MNVNPNLKKAKRRGQVPVIPRHHEIQIDLDSIPALDRFAWAWRYLRSCGLTNGWKARLAPSVTPKHTHITISLPRARPLRERVLLALLFGSDYRREVYNYVRVVKRSRYPVLFFENGPKIKKKIGTARAKVWHGG